MKVEAYEVHSIALYVLIKNLLSSIVGCNVAFPFYFRDVTHKFDTFSSYTSILFIFPGYST